jgi:UDP-glucose 4-epimerase
MKKVIVTGGAGFIGSHLVDALLKNGCDVAVVDDLSGGSLSNIHSDAHFYKCDIRRAAQINKVISEFKPDTIYHLAANAAENKAQFSPVDITSRNFDGAIKVLTAGINNGVKRFIFASSIAVYGQLQTPFKESDTPVPEDVYGVAKLSFEHVLKILSEVHKFEYVIVRPHNVYGPRQNMRDPYRNAIMIFMNHLLKMTPFYIYGDGDQLRCFSYIDDVVTALVGCGTKPVAGMTFNIGSDQPYSIKQLSEKIIAISGVSLQPKYLPARPREVTVAISDHTLSKRHLQYQDSVSFDEGLQITWAWAKNIGYQKPKFTKVEIESPLLPENWRQ